MTRRSGFPQHPLNTWLPVWRGGSQRNIGSITAPLIDPDVGAVRDPTRTGMVADVKPPKENCYACVADR